MAEQDDRVQEIEAILKASGISGGLPEDIKTPVCHSVALDIVNEYIIPLVEQERKRIYEWGNEACPHAGTVAGEPLLHKHDCYVCWEPLKQGKVKE